MIDGDLVADFNGHYFFLFLDATGIGSRFDGSLSIMSIVFVAMTVVGYGMPETWYFM